MVNREMQRSSLFGRKEVVEHIHMKEAVIGSGAGKSIHHQHEEESYHG
jgi:hypothetical protein